jgi:hypothetical protein
MGEEKTDNDLMNKFKRCSDADYEQIVQRYKDRLFNCVLRAFQLSGDHSEEVVQNTPIRVNECRFTWIEKAYAERDRGMTGLNFEPLLDPVRSDP